MFAKPILNIGMVTENLNCSFGKASALIQTLVNLNIIKVCYNCRKNTLLYCYTVFYYLKSILNNKYYINII